MFKEKENNNIVGLVFWSQILQQQEYDWLGKNLFVCVDLRLLDSCKIILSSLLIQ